MRSMHMQYLLQADNSVNQRAYSSTDLAGYMDQAATDDKTLDHFLMASFISL